MDTIISAPNTNTSTSPKPSPAPPVPAPKSEPILASELLKSLINRREKNCRDKNHRKVRTGWAELDDYVLLGGVERGVVLGVCADVGGEDGVGVLISLHLLVTALLENPDAKASVVDTVGSFPVSMLAKIIRHRVTTQDSAGQRKDRIDMVDERVKDVLSRVAISRVFDIEGVWEVISEIARDCELHQRANIAQGRMVHDLTLPCVESEGDRILEVVLPASEIKGSKLKEIEIQDSQEEDEEFEIDPTINTDHTTIPVEENIRADETIPIPTVNPSIKTSPNPGTTEIIIISNITTPINELFSRRERSAAHTLISSFARSLQNITQTNSIITILLNTLTRPYNPLGALATTAQVIPPQSRSPFPPLKQGISVFSSTTARPSLGKIFEEIVGNGLSLMVSRVPRMRNDAEIVYGNLKGGPDGDSQGDIDEGQGNDKSALEAERLEIGGEEDKRARMSIIIEVLKDRVPDYDFWADQINPSPPQTSNKPTDPDAKSNKNQTPTHNKTQDESPKRKPERARRKCRTQRWAAFDLSPTDSLNLIPFPNNSANGVRAGSTRDAREAPESERVHLVK